MYRTPLVDLQGAELNRKRLLGLRQKEASFDAHARNAERLALERPSSKRDRRLRKEEAVR